MPAERVSMRRVREILRLKFECGAPTGRLRVAVGVARSTVQLCLARFAAAGLSWPLPATLSERGLEALLFARHGGSEPGKRRKAEPDWTPCPPRAAPPRRDAACCSGRSTAPSTPAVTATAAGASSTAAGRPGCRRPCARCTLPASGCSSTTPGRRSRWSTAAPARCARRRCSSRCWARRTTPTPRRAGRRALPDWIGSHVRALAFLGGVPRQIVPDNLSAGVLERTGTSRGSTRPTATWRRTTARRSCRPGCAGRATRPRSRPACWSWSAGSWRVCAISASSRWSSSTRRSRCWSKTSMPGRCADSASAAASCSSELDQPALSAAAARSPTYMPNGASAASALDYHVDIEGHYYSVPHRLLREQVEARITARTIELFHKGERVAVHMRGGARGRHTTLPEHMPTGASTTCRVDDRADRPRGGCHRPAHGDADRADPARAGRIPSRASGLVSASCAWRASYGPNGWRRPARAGSRSAPAPTAAIQSILQHGLDRQPRRASAARRVAAARHPNIRGSRYYH